MTEERSQPEDRTPEHDDVDLELRDVLKGAVSATAAAAAITGTGALVSSAAHAEKSPLLERVAEAVIDRDHFPFAQTKRNWLANVPNWFEFPSKDKNELEVWAYTDKLTYGQGDLDQKVFRSLPGESRPRIGKNQHNL